MRLQSKTIKLLIIVVIIVAGIIYWYLDRVSRQISECSSLVTPEQTKQCLDKYKVIPFLNNKPQIETITKNILKSVQLIDSTKDYEIITLNNEEFLGHTTDGGGQLTGYFKDNEVSKIIERVGLSYGAMNLEYYFLNGKLIFVNEREGNFPDSNNDGTLNHTKLETVFQKHYYFHEEKLIDSQTTGERRFSADTKPGDLINTVTKHIELLRKSR